jgi:integrase
LALLSAAEGDWRGVILVGFYCGMRLNDACNLRWPTSTLFQINPKPKVSLPVAEERLRR